MTIDIKNMPLNAILGWLDAPKDEEHQQIIATILTNFQQNVIDSLLSGAIGHEQTGQNSPATAELPSPSNSKPTKSSKKRGG